MSKLTLEEVRHIALLSRLELSEEEFQRYTVQLTEIITYAEKIQELDTENVPPTSHAIPRENVWREDGVEPSLCVEKAIGNADEKVNNEFIRVPKVAQEVT